jgi:hypothetical protein
LCVFAPTENIPIVNIATAKYMTVNTVAFAVSE